MRNKADLRSAVGAPGSGNTINWSVTAAVLTVIFIFTLICGNATPTVKNKNRMIDTRRPKIAESPFPKPVAQLEKLQPAVAREAADALRLYRHTIAVCAPNSNTSFVDDNLVGRVLQCWCAEKDPLDNRNCLLRVRGNAIVHKLFSLKKSQMRTIIYTHVPFPLPVPLSFQVASIFPIEIRGFENRDWRPYPGVNSANRRPKSAKAVAKIKPYFATIDDAPMLLIPDAIHQDNFYHTIMGPTGLVQIVATRDAIDQFYSEINQRIITSNDTLLIADEMLREPVTNTVSGSSRFLPHPARTADYDSNIARCHGQAVYATNHSTRRTFLAKEVLFNNDIPLKAGPGSKGTFDRLAHELEFCQVLLPSHSFTTIHNDLWIGKLFGLAGSLFDVRRERAVLRPHYVAPDVRTPILTNDFTSLCPASNEEATGARAATQRVQDVLTRGMQGLNDDDSKSVNCTSIKRINDSKIHCVLVSGRPLMPLKHRTRGLAENMEIAILNAIMTPLNEPVRPTLEGEQARSRWLDLSAAAQISNCIDDEGGRSYGATDATSSSAPSASEIIEHINYDAGMAPCRQASKQQIALAKARYPGTSFPFHVYEGLTFNKTSQWFDAAAINRTDLSNLTVFNQFKVVSSANLFIFEEGASATWAQFAPPGSTFIMPYNSNRFRGDSRPAVPLYKRVYTKNKQRRKGKTKGRRNQPPYSTATDWEHIAHTEHFIFHPYITQNVRMIFFIYVDGRLPSFSKLREAFDRPWKPESVFISCECNISRLAPYDLTHGKCE